MLGWWGGVGPRGARARPGWEQVWELSAEALLGSRGHGSRYNPQQGLRPSFRVAPTPWTPGIWGEHSHEHITPSQSPGQPPNTPGSHLPLPQKPPRACAVAIEATSQLELEWELPPTFPLLCLLRGSARLAAVPCVDIIGDGAAHERCGEIPTHDVFSCK